MKVGHFINRQLGFNNTGHTVFFPVPLSYYLTTLVAGMQHHFKVPKISIAGDFDIEGEFYATGTSFVMIAGCSTSPDYLCVTPTSDLQLAIGGAYLPLGVDVPRNKLVSYKISRRSGQIIGTVGEASRPPIENTSAFSFDYLCRYNGSGHFFSGFMPFINFSHGAAQEGNTKGNPHYKINKNWIKKGLNGLPDTPSNILRNSNAVDGPELWVNPVLIGGATYVNNVLSINTAGDKQGGEVFVPGNTHATLSFDVDLTSGEIHLAVASNVTGNVFGTDISSSGSYEFLVDSSDTVGIKRKFATGLVVAEISNISLEESLGAGTVVNISHEDTFKVTEQKNGDLIATDSFLENGDFELDDKWNKSGSWIISEGKATTAESNKLLYQAVVRPPSYLVKGKLLDNGLRFYDGNEYSTVIHEQGSFSFEVDNTDDSYGYFTIKSSDVGASLKEIEAYTILRKAQ